MSELTGAIDDFGMAAVSLAGSLPEKLAAMRAGASTTPMPKMPLARPCSFGRNARRMMMAGIGWTTPAASPSATRAAITSVKYGASPPTMPPAISSSIVPA